MEIQNWICAQKNSKTNNLMSDLKRIIKLFLPPIILETANKFDSKQKFELDIGCWNDAERLCTGYGDGKILDKVLSATLKVKRGETVFERDSVTFDQVQYSWPVTSALMWAAARTGGELNVLDFGGALGTSYFQNLKFVSKIKHVTWSIVEQENFVKAGRAHIEDEIVKFYNSVDDLNDPVVPNVVLLSSAIQYVPDIHDVLGKLNSIKAKILIFDRTPLSDMRENMLCIQRVPKKIYEASYPMWIVSKVVIENCLTNWRLVESFPCAEGRFSLRKNVNFEFSGLIYENRNV